MQILNNVCRWNTAEDSRCRSCIL